GVASALLGMLQFSIGAGTGAIVGLLHDGTGRPMAVTMAACATLSLLITITAERMTTHNPAPVAALAD
ncbi:hypothetical protein ACYOEI_33350, partial [Singulisphaera rosea]